MNQILENLCNTFNMRVKPGLHGLEANKLRESDCFKLFFDDEIINIILSESEIYIKKNSE